MWASQKENTDKRKYVILKYKLLERNHWKIAMKREQLEDSI